DSKLRDLGFDPEAAPDQAIAKLRSLRAAAGEGAIAQALGGIATAEAAAMLAEMEAGASGAARRGIRRAVFRSRQKGVLAPEQATPATPSAVESETGLTALLSPADTEGASIAWLIKARAGGGLKRLWGLVSETEGLLGVQIETISRKDLRKEQTQLEQRA